MALLWFFVLSAAVLLLKIKTWILASEPTVPIDHLYANNVLPEFKSAHEIGINWTSTILNSMSILYWGGVGILFIHFLSQLIGIIRLSCQYRTLKIGNINVHLLPNAQGPFSFFQWIFINPSIHNEQELDEILTHEFTHAS